jgi:hypothetical protein
MRPPLQRLNRSRETSAVQLTLRKTTLSKWWTIILILARRNLRVCYQLCHFAYGYRESPTTRLHPR